MPRRKPRVRRSPSQIRKLVKEFETSGLSKSEFADHIGVHSNTVGKWIRETAGSPTSPAPQAVVPVRVVRPMDHVARAADIEIGLRGGRSVRLRGEVDEKLLRRLVEILER